MKATLKGWRMGSWVLKTLLETMKPPAGSQHHLWTSQCQESVKSSFSSAGGILRNTHPMHQPQSQKPSFGSWSPVSHPHTSHPAQEEPGFKPFSQSLSPCPPCALTPSPWIGPASKATDGNAMMLNIVGYSLKQKWCFMKIVAMSANSSVTSTASRNSSCTSGLPQTCFLPTSHSSHKGLKS